MLHLRDPCLHSHLDVSLSLYTYIYIYIYLQTYVDATITETSPYTIAVVCRVYLSPTNFVSGVSTTLYSHSFWRFVLRQNKKLSTRSPTNVFFRNGFISSTTVIGIGMADNCHLRRSHCCEHLILRTGSRSPGIQAKIYRGSNITKYFFGGVKTTKAYLEVGNTAVIWSIKWYLMQPFFVHWWWCLVYKLGLAST